MKGACTRRTFLVRTSSGIAGLLATSLAGAGAEVSLPRLAQTLAAIFREPREAGAIGRAYLESLDAPPAWPDLCTDLLGAFAGSAQLPSDEELLNHLNERARHDFSEGRTFVVDGWVLSRTEAEICGLVHLLSKASTSL